MQQSIAEVAELADAQDLKSCEPQIRTGSSPVFGIKMVNEAWRRSSVG